LLQSLRPCASPPVRISQRANGRQIPRLALQDERELFTRLVDTTELGQRAAKRNPRRQKSRMNLQAGLTRSDRLLILPRSPVLFSELRESDGRRIVLHPAPEIFNS
jgi:hypothetical protein